MAHIIVQNRDNCQLMVNPALSLLQQLQREGIEVPTGCGGHARCGFCKVTFIEGLENANTPNRNEELYRREHPLPDSVRLACQTYVLGPAVIRIGTAPA